MQLFNSLKNSLKAKFIIGMGMMLFPLVVLSIGSFLSLHNVIAAFEEATEETIDEQLPIMQLRPLLLKATIPVKNYVNFGEPEERGKFIIVSKETEQAFKTASSAPFALKEEKELVKSAYIEWQQSKLISEKILASPFPVTTNAGTEIKLVDVHIDNALNNLNTLLKISQPEIAAELTEAHSIRKKTFLAIAIVFGISLVAAIGASLLLARSVLIPLKTLKKSADRFGTGDLSHRAAIVTADELGQLTVAFNIMAENLEKTQKELKILSTHDSLTGLNNRKEFHRYLQEELERSKRYDCPLSLLMLDIDFFKNINDTYGHQAGDLILSDIANLLKRECRIVDQISRYGGEEFTIILPETSASGALIIAERIRKLVANTTFFVGPGQEISVTLCVGVAVYKEDATTENALISAADEALYAAKHAGRNRVCSYTKPS